MKTHSVKVKLKQPAAWTAKPIIPAKLHGQKVLYGFPDLQIVLREDQSCFPNWSLTFSSISVFLSIAPSTRSVCFSHRASTLLAASLWAS